MVAKRSIRSEQRWKPICRLVLVLLLLACSSVPGALGQEEGSEHPEQQAEEPPPVQQDETVPVETPPVVEEEEDDEEPINTDHLFELNIFECTAPRGDPAPVRKGPLPPNSIMTLCFRPKHTDATFRSIGSMDFKAKRGPSQAAIRDNEAAGPMTRLVCPMMEDPSLCISATKLNDDFFEKAYKSAAVTGQIVMLANGEERSVSFQHDFSTSQAPKQPPVEHEFMEFPEQPKAFPCGREIRLWILLALVLTLLEFAFSPSTEGSGTAGGDNNNSNGGGSKKKKSKKE